MGFRDAVRGFLSGWRGQAPFAAVSPSAPSTVAPATSAVSAWQTAAALELPTQSDVPQAWIATQFGPGWPITPFGLGGQRNVAAETEPRSYQYIPNVNATLSPRIAYGLTPFSQLQFWGENVPEPALFRRLLVEELKNFVPQILGPDGNVVQKARVVVERDKKGRPVYDEVGGVRVLRKAFTGDNELEVPGLGWMTTAPTPTVRARDGQVSKVLINERDYGKWQAQVPARDGEYGPIFIENGAPVMKAQETSVSVADIAWEISRPDRYNAFPRWLSRFIYNTVVYDAGCFYRVRDADGRTIGMRVVDGSTIFCIISDLGEAPAPPAPAFTQIIFGQPRQWFNTLQLWYSPRQLRANAPYGIAFTEDSARAVMFLDNLWTHELAYYTEGTAPEAFLAAPANWTPEQCIEYEKLLNSRYGGNSLERRRLKVIANGMELKDVKPHDWPEHSYAVARDMVALTAGIHPSELGKLQGTGLSGSKGGQEKGEDSHARMGIGPLKKYIESAFNDVLLESGYQGHTFELGALDIEIDPKEDEQMWATRWENGGIKRNEYREGLGIDGVKGPEGDAYMLPVGKEPQVYGPDGKPAPLGPDGKPVKPPPLAGQPGLNGAKPPAPGANGAQPGKDENAKPEGGVPEEGGQAKKYQVETHSGAMVAVFIPQDVARELYALVTEPGALPDDAGVESPESMHVTLAFFPDEPQDAQQVVAAMQTAVLGYGPLDCKVQGFGVFRGVEGGARDALWAALDCSSLPAIRQTLCAALDKLGIEYGQDHGFTPHITLAYLPKGASIPQAVLDHRFGHAVTIPELCYCQGDQRTTVPFNGSAKSLNNANLNGRTAGFEKAWHVSDVAKHCGVCPDDDAYFGAPVSRETTVLFPEQGANDTEIVAMSPRGLERRPALWKPRGGEDDRLAEAIGGPMYVREEAAYLLDRSLGFYLVPLAYAATVDDEPGAVIHYVRGNEPRQDVSQYAPAWVERAAVLDCVTGQTDRRDHNWLTHPDDDTRPICFDNGLSFPVDEHAIGSAFAVAWAGQPLSPDVLASLRRCAGDVVWRDIEDLVGAPATARARERLRLLCELERIPAVETANV